MSIKSTPLPEVSGEIYSPFVVKTEGEERAVRFERLKNDIKDLSGRILTIVDASIADKTQNKAMKDLIKSQFARTLGRYEDICFYGKRGQSYFPEL